MNRYQGSPIHIFCIASGHIWATYSNFLYAFSWSGWLESRQYLCFCTSCRVTSPPRHMGTLLMFWGYGTHLQSLLWDFIAFGECWDLLVSLSPCLPSLPIHPAVLTHPCCPQVHSVFPPSPVMFSSTSQVSQMLWNTCRDHGEYPLPSPLARSDHWPLISYPRVTKLYMYFIGVYMKDLQTS